MNKWFRLVPAFDLECPDCNRLFKNTDYDGYYEHVLRDHGIDIRRERKLPNC
jgi:uncharacterized C2H2 Zn-finger protein